jgi:copper(I)-binding protein
MDMTSHQHTSRSLRRIGGTICVVGALTLATGCGNDKAASSSTTAGTNLTTGIVTTQPAAGVAAISGQWARTSPSMAGMGAAYVTINSQLDDKLMAVKVDAGVAASAELHETVMGTGSDTTMAMGGGEMSMRPVEFIDVPAGTTVELKPGGYHIMLIDLVQPLEAGTTLQLTLVFEQAGEITIDVPVQEAAP